MAVTALPLSTKISQSSSKNLQTNLLVAKFGDGYEQRTPNGINYTKQQWTIQWENITTTELTTIETAIASARYGADAFTWTPFNEASQKKFKYNYHDVTFLSGNLCTVSMSIIQVYDV
jgi:phage-related protein